MAIFNRNGQRRSLVERDKQHLIVKSLDAHVVWDFIHSLLDGLKAGFMEFEVDLSLVGDARYYPNVITPISAFCDQLGIQRGVGFKLVGATPQLGHTNILDPKPAGRTSAYPTMLNKVWKFDTSEDVFKLVTEYLDEIYKADVFDGKDVLTGLEWCLNEVMDNVIQHANANYGYVMGQVHPNTKHIAFCIVDCGQGILKSLWNSAFFPKSAEDALTMAIKEGVTRDEQIGQGNGLWGLTSIVQDNKGSLNLASSGQRLNTIEGVFYRYPYLNREKGGTVVDFQMDYSKPISLKTVLKGYTPMSLKVFKAQDNPTGHVVYKVIDQKSGFGTRKSGERIRFEIINLINQTGDTIEIDFDGVGVVSSSFADELIGKLFVEFGPISFSSHIRLSNMNETVEAIINKAVEQRIAQENTSSK